ncbi:hypothetical protein [Caballeronia sp. dw_276]|nr:hypothetical protein [Caballeronia sp. dw_276]
MVVGLRIGFIQAPAACQHDWKPDLRGRMSAETATGKARRPPSGAA